MPVIARPPSLLPFRHHQAATPSPICKYIQPRTSMKKIILQPRSRPLRRTAPTAHDILYYILHIPPRCFYMSPSCINPTQITAAALPYLRLAWPARRSTTTDRETTSLLIPLTASKNQRQRIVEAI
eukprot:scaffold415601_cov18-Prasinocladus_malaysianus.AAC.1